jgi:hypothetical protein
LSTFAELLGYIKKYGIIILAGMSVRKNSPGHYRHRGLSNVDVALGKQHGDVN